MTELLHRLGQSVRQRRAALELTQRELAETAGVSDRFLISVERGVANISVLKLESIAHALGVDGATLMVEARAGDEAESSPADGSPLLIALLGLRGAGKSTIGKAAANALGWPFVELDALIEQRVGMGPGEIFELHGRAYYHRLEREEVQQLLGKGEPCIVATAGGIVTDHPTYEVLLKQTTCVWLKAKPGDHMQRVLAQGDARPVANRPDAMTELRGLLRARRALYERAPHIIDTSSLGLDAAIARLVRLARATEEVVRKAKRK